MEIIKNKNSRSNDNSNNEFQTKTCIHCVHCMHCMLKTNFN
jgi:hypothetical protein